MKLIKPSFEIWNQEEGLEGIYKQIERAGRVCYKSEDKIAEGTAKAFVDRMITSGHGAMLEHGTVYMFMETRPQNGDLDEYMEQEYFYEKYYSNKYSFVRTRKEGTYVTTNFRVLAENEWLEDLKYQCEPTEYHEKRITVKFICDRGVSHEFVRHRVFSFAQESTRYCNYSRDKFGNEITCIIPSWLEITEGSYTLKDIEERYDNCLITNPDKGITIEAAEYIRSLLYSERAYFLLLNGYEHNWIAQEVRTVLPNSLKTELVMTGTVSQWEGFFKLRDAGSAHPQARELAHPLHEEFIKRGFVSE